MCAMRSSVLPRNLGILHLCVKVGIQHHSFILKASYRLIKALLSRMRFAGPSSFATNAKPLVVRVPQCPPHRGSGALRMIPTA